MEAGAPIGTLELEAQGEALFDPWREVGKQLRVAKAAAIQPELLARASEESPDLPADEMTRRWQAAGGR